MARTIQPEDEEDGKTKNNYSSHRIMPSAP
jgi:hypothetical protein